jgi:O-antigen/teichoic acid export membrane protein
LTSKSTVAQPCGDPESPAIVRMADSRPLGTRLLAAASSNLLVFGARILVTLFVTPITFHALGRFDYGIWEIILSVANYIALLDVGVRPSVARFTTLHVSEKAYDQLRESLSTAWVFTMILGGVAVVIFSAWAAWWFAYPPRLLAHPWRYPVTLLIIGCQLALLFPSQVADSALEGLQAYVARNSVLLTLILTGGLVIAIWIGYFDALIFIATANTCSTAIKSLVFFRMVRARVPGWQLFSVKAATLACYKRLARFGVKSLLQGTGEDIVTFAPPLVIGAVLGPAVIPVFRIPAALGMYAQNVGWTAVYSFMTFFVELSASGDEDKLRRTFLTGSRLIVALILPVAVTVLAIGAPFIGRWISADLGHETRALIPWIVVMYLTPLLSPISITYLTAMAKHGGIAAVGTLLSVAGVIAGTVCAMHFGLLGFAICMAVAVLLKVPYRTHVACRNMGLPMKQYVAAVAWPAVPCALAQYLTMELIARHSSLATWPALFGTGMAGLMVYIAAVAGFASESDRSMIRTLMHRAPPGTRRPTTVP